MNVDTDKDNQEYWDLFFKLYAESQTPKEQPYVKAPDLTIQKQLIALKTQVLALNDKLEMVNKINKEQMLLCDELKQELIGIKGECILLQKFFVSKGLKDTDFEKWKNNQL